MYGVDGRRSGRPARAAQVGIGQLFRQFDLLPRFTLLEAGLHPRQPGRGWLLGSMRG